MADKQSSFTEIKKAIIGVVTLAITTAGGLFIANMENIFKSEDKKEIVTEPAEPSAIKDTIVVISQQKKEPQVVAKPEAPVKKEKEYEW